MSNNESKKHKYTFVLNEQEWQLLEELVARGFRRVEIFRQGLRLLYRKEVPAYASAKPKTDAQGKELTAEEICIAQGGEVVTVNGLKKCKIKKGNLEYFEPL